MGDTYRDRLYINGAWVASSGTGTIDVINSATEQVMGRVPASTTDDVDAAVAAARVAFEGWSQTSPYDRSKLCDELASRLGAANLELSTLMAQEVGTSMPSAMMVQAGVAPLLFAQYAQIARDYEWEKPVGSSIVVSEPIGVVAAITPWNYPLTLIAYKLAPALAAGCTVVLKPSEIAPLNAFALADIIHDIGFPPGVFNLVPGLPASGARLVEHPDVDMVSFTGSTATGAKVMAAAAATIKRVHLELGGKSANIILDDANLEDALTKGLGQVYMNSGQTCLAWTRILVPHAKMDEAAALAKKITEENWTPGDPLSYSAPIGPLVSKAQQERVRGFIAKGIEEGATLVTGGAEQPEGLDAGYFVKPTVFSHVTPDMTISREEIFGPVISIIGYEDDDEAVRIANDSIYGLHGAVFSADVERAKAIARRMRTGQIDINGMGFNPLAPFGGYRQSGNGKELGVEGFEGFLEQKSLQL